MSEPDLDEDSVIYKGTKGNNNRLSTTTTKNGAQSRQSQQDAADEVSMDGGDDDMTVTVAPHDYSDQIERKKSSLESATSLQALTMSPDTR